MIIPNLEILSNVNAKYNSATFKTATFESAKINSITLPGEKDVIVSNTTWNGLKADIANSVSKTNTGTQTIAGTLQVTSGINSDVFRSKTGNAITAFAYVSNQGFKYSNVYEMIPYGKTDPFFTISSGNTTLSATVVKGTSLYENGTNISEIYLKKGAVPADVYSKADIDDMIGDINKSIDKKQNALTPGTNIDITGSTISVTGVYTSSKVDELLANKVDKTTYNAGMAAKQDLLQVGGNLIAGSNVNITEVDGKITISSTGGGGTVDAYTKAQTDQLLLAKQNKLTAGSNISITTSVIDATTVTTINTKNIYVSAEIDSKISAINSSIAAKQDTLVPGTNLIEGDNITITKDSTSGKITISSLSDLSALIARVAALEKQLGSYTLKAVTQSEYDSLTTKDANTLYFIKAS